MTSVFVKRSTLESKGVVCEDGSLMNYCEVHDERDAVQCPIVVATFADGETIQSFLLGSTDVFEFFSFTRKGEESFLERLHKLGISEGGLDGYNTLLYI